MAAHDFTLVLFDAELTDDQCNRLYEAGCDDATISSSEGIAHIDFARQSPSLEQAIRSAIADVNSAGLKVSRVEIEATTLASH